MSKGQLYQFYLFGSQLLSLEQNNDLFSHFQSYISESKRFYKKYLNTYFPAVSIP